MKKPSLRNAMWDAPKSHEAVRYLLKEMPVQKRAADYGISYVREDGLFVEVVVTVKPVTRRAA